MSETVATVAKRPARHQKKKTPRPDLIHWPMPWEFTIRAATNADGPAIHALVDTMTKQYGYVLPDCQWDNIAPFWYVAELQGVLIGAVQICIGRPIGRVELLAIHPGLSHSKRAKVVKALGSRCLAAMHLDGTELVCLVVPERDDDMIRILERCGARYAVKGKMMFYSLVS